MDNPEGYQLLRSALGRVGFIGELYDVRNESFTSTSLFTDTFRSKFLKRINTSNLSFDYKMTENVSDRFDLLNVEAEIQVSLLCGLFEADGCGKFLSENKNSANIVSCSLLCKFQTVCEKVFASFEEMIENVDLCALRNPQYTHVIVEVNWGANCILNFQQKFAFESEKKQIEGLLGSEVKKLINFLSVKGDANVNYMRGNSLKETDIRIKIVADVVPDGQLPTTTESLCDFIKKIPDSLKTINDGKGKPLNYALIPLDGLRKAAGLAENLDSLVRSVDESFLISVVCLFEEISAEKEKLEIWVSEMREWQNYLAEEAIIEGKKHLESLRVKESQLKGLIAQDWFSVRSGKQALRALIRRIEKFRARDLNLFEYEDYLNSVQIVRRQITRVKNFTSHGAAYLEKGKLFAEELNQNLMCDFIVLLVAKDYENTNFALHQSTCHHFLSLITTCENSEKKKFIVVDLDLDFGRDNQTSNKAFFSNLGIHNVSCMRFKEGRLLNADLYGTYLWEKKSNLARLKTGSETERVEQAPGNRIPLQMACPGRRLAGCSSDSLTWHCFRCKELLEYGFDDYFYCSCGRGRVLSFEYRCGHEDHGAAFLSAESEFLIDHLSTLRPLKELNVLILGQSGVGKSTWINSMVNYLNYESLEQAKENGVICTIPIKFAAYDRETGKRQEVEIGETSGNNEIVEAGKSGTQFCSTYSFLWRDRYIRIIDTPGIGDTRGIHQDKENMKNIIDHVCHLKELHGICILMKANDCRISAIFSYCLKELLIHMHKSVARNIVFCFTSARNSFYTPGQTSVLLEKQLESLGIEKELSMGYHNRFCLDNEAFLFLCTLKYSNISHDETLVKSFAQSWDISLKETLRLFNTIAKFKPHMLHHTRSLFTARNRILFLSRPIAEMSKTIQMNLAAIEKRKKEVNESEKTLENLSKKLYHDEIHLEPLPLELPRTVCTSSKCVRYHRIEGLDITDIEYVTHCHSVCYLKEIVPKAVNNPLLRDCSAIDKEGNCRKCGCHWRNHMHITFDQRHIKKKAINKKIQSDMLKEKSDKEKIEAFVRTLQEKIKKYEKEQLFIIRVSVKFGMFLKDNAISVYNDAVSDYLKYLISEEQEKPHKTESDERLLKNLKETLEHYEAEVKILQEVTEKGNHGEEVGIPTVDEVYELERKLYELELTGADIKKYADANFTASSTVLSYRETHLRIPNIEQEEKQKLEKKSAGRTKKWIFF